uniref:FecR family protein n=1 Tax=Pedobacter schmidteae TaxID=2201271 RepID=UPI000EAC8EF5|nr:FecR family protein [Pedobacter schmidteae]
MNEERFTELLTRKMADELTADELAEFDDLISVNKSYRAEYEQLQDYWDEEETAYPNMEGILAQIKKQADIPEKDNRPLVKHPENSKRSYSWIPRIAALLFFTLFAVFAYRSFFSKEKQDKMGANIWKEIHTRDGQISKVTLADGSQITLNSASYLKYPAAFSGPNREVHLSGEAYFDVAEDHAHPFILHTSQMNIRVLGTAFNVKSYDNDLFKEATLLRGSIEVKLTGKNNESLKLVPTDKIRVKGSSYEIGKLSYYNKGDKNSLEILWMNNQLAFRNETLETIANSLGRKYGLKMIFNDEKTKNLKFSVSFEKENVNQALNSLQTVSPFQYKIKGDSVYFY